MPRWSRATSARSTARRQCRQGRSLGGATCPGLLGWTGGGVHRRAMQQRGGQQEKWQRERVISGELVLTAAGGQWPGAVVQGERRHTVAWAGALG